MTTTPNTLDRNSNPTGRSAGTAALDLRGVRVAYPDGPDLRVVLDDLDLTVERGEMVVIVGESGAGKSTLLTAAGLLRRPDAGEISVAGTATSVLSERRRTQIRRDHVAFVYQSANLLPTLTAIEQLEIVGHIRGERSAVARARAMELLDGLGLAGRKDQLPAQLSGGERQRVGIGRAFMAEPTILIADEPTASLDPDRSRAVVELLRSAADDRDIATLVVAHDEAPAAAADRVLRLEAGRLRALNGTGAGPTVKM
ncbi:MAG: ABC transporter ATP-binding protein [Acidimicrobiales bacterium]|nr:ABC transporter ATP-binding protein [Acidimicrobiales bacterium]